MKKVLVFVLTLSMILSFGANAFAAFPDMPEGVDGEILQRAVDNGLLTGFEDGTIQPGTPITRAQMAAILSRALGASETEDITGFVDVNENDWYYNDMQKAVYMGAFKGDDQSRLNPNNTITRQEAFIVLYRIFSIPDSREGIIEAYSDGAQVADWARKEVSAVASAYIGDVQYIRPLDPMTRLEFAQLMDKIVKTYVDAPGTYTTFPEGGVLVRSNDVNLKGVKNATAIYIGDGVSTLVNFDECDCERVVVRGKKIAVNSGQYNKVIGIGMGTRIYITRNPFELVKVHADGTMGSFYAAPNRAVLVPTVQNVTTEN